MSKHTPEQMSFYPRLSGSENHKGFSVFLGKNLIGEFYPLDEDGIKGKAVAQAVTDQYNALAGIPDPAAYVKAMREVCEAQTAADDAIDAYEKNDDLDPEILGAALKRRRQAIDAYRTLSTPESEVK